MDDLGGAYLRKNEVREARGLPRKCVGLKPYTLFLQH